MFLAAYVLTGEITDDNAFRRARPFAVLKAGAKAYGWNSHPSPKPRRTGNILTGCGIAYGLRGQTIVAEIAGVEVNRQTGHVRAKRLACAHDRGLVVNPPTLHHEEVQFDTEEITSLD